MVSFEGKIFTITVIQVYAPTTNAKEVAIDQFYENIQQLLELTPKKKKKVLFITGNWNAKVGSQDIPGVTGKFDLGVQNEAGQRLTQSFAQRMHWSLQIPSCNNKKDDSTHRHYQMVSTEIRLIIFFAAEDGETLYSQQK